MLHWVHNLFFPRNGFQWRSRAVWLDMCNSTIRLSGAELCDCLHTCVQDVLNERLSGVSPTINTKSLLLQYFEPELTLGMLTWRNQPSILSRLSVLGAITSVQQRLKLYTRGAFLFQYDILLLKSSFILSLEGTLHLTLGLAFAVHHRPACLPARLPIQQLN